MSVKYAVLTGNSSYVKGVPPHGGHSFKFHYFFAMYFLTSMATAVIMIIPFMIV